MSGAGRSAADAGGGGECCGGGGGAGPQQPQAQKPQALPTPSPLPDPPLLLSLPTDATYLSHSLCLVRRQIEVFAATEHDISERRRLGGSVRPPALGRVGLRCVHCRDAGEGGAGEGGGVDKGRGRKPWRARGAETYPGSVRVVHQSVRNFQRYHLTLCDRIPPWVREELSEKKRGGKGQKGRGRDYWTEGCLALGMVDAAHGKPDEHAEDVEGIVFRPRSRAMRAKIAADQAEAGHKRRTAAATATATAAAAAVAGTGAEAVTKAEAFPRVDKLLQATSGAKGKGKQPSPVQAPRPTTQRWKRKREGEVENFITSSLDPSPSKTPVVDAKTATLPSISLSRCGTALLRGREREIAYLASVLDRSLSGHGVSAVDTADVANDAVSNVAEGALSDGTLSHPPPGFSSTPRSSQPGLDASPVPSSSALGGAWREVVLISGDEGVGKTSLAELAVMQWVRSGAPGVRLVRGTFFPPPPGPGAACHQPLLALFAAFDVHCRSLLGNGGNGSAAEEERNLILAQVRSRLAERVGFVGLSVLSGAVPALSALMALGPSSCGASILVCASDFDPTVASNRFSYYFGQMVQALTLPSSPVLLVLDDLQWADQASLRLLTVFLSDSDITSLSFVGCFREDEVIDNHPLRLALRELPESDVCVHNIKLGNLDRDGVNQIVMDILNIPKEASRSLADGVHARTAGNPSVVVRLLESLREKDGKWDAVVDGSAGDITSLDLSFRNISQLSPQAQNLMKIAACLGPSFSAATVGFLSDDDHIACSASLKELTKERIMKAFGVGYAFRENQIYLTAYRLMSDDDRTALHLRIGRKLLQIMSVEEGHSSMFVVVDHLCQGRANMTEKAEKAEVAKICLVAGKAAMTISSFQAACHYFLQGINLLEECDWKNHNYELYLRLRSYASKAHHCAGDNKGAMITLKAVFDHSRRLEDKVPAWKTYMLALGAEGNATDAISFGIDTLKELGETFPESPSQSIMMDWFKMTQKMLGSVTIDEILARAKMTDPAKLAVMDLLTTVGRRLTCIVCFCNQRLAIMHTLRQVQITLQSGVAKESAYAFACFGMHARKYVGFKMACHYGKVALALVRQFDWKDTLPRVAAVVNATLAYHDMPSVRLNALKDAIQVGFSAGDPDSSYTCANIYAGIALSTGQMQLGKLAPIIRNDLKQMRAHRHVPDIAICMVQHQVVKNLTSLQDRHDPTDIRSDLPANDARFNTPLVTYQVAVYRLWLAYFFRRYDVALAAISQCNEAGRRLPMRTSTEVVETLYTGLVAAYMAGRKRAPVLEGGGWEGLAASARARIKKWAEVSGRNFSHQLHLLDAEIAQHVRGDRDAAVRGYERAAEAAEAHGFLHEQALSWERAGLSYGGDRSLAPPAEGLGGPAEARTALEMVPDKARDCLDRARELYGIWGAAAKVRDIDRLLEEIWCPSLSLYI